MSRKRVSLVKGSVLTIDTESQRGSLDYLQALAGKINWLANEDKIETNQPNGTELVSIVRTDPFTLDADFGYAGMYHHAASGLNLTWHRAYDSDSGRWLSRDPIEEAGGLNLYDYVGNDPVNEFDLQGLWPDWYDNWESHQPPEDPENDLGPNKKAGNSWSNRKGAGGKGWEGDANWNHLVKQCKKGGDVNLGDNAVPTKDEALRILDQAGAKPYDISNGHQEGGVSTHTEPHINFNTADGNKGTIPIQPF